jgi:hypothetical protein
MMRSGHQFCFDAPHVRPHGGKSIFPTTIATRRCFGVWPDGYLIPLLTWASSVR